MQHAIKVLLLLTALNACATGTPATQPSAPGSTDNPSSPTPVASAETVNFSVAHAIVQARCVTCHAQTPTHEGFSFPGGGVTFDTPEQIRSKASRILARAVQSKSMPQGNATGMTDEEREKLRIWIEAGAKID